MTEEQRERQREACRRYATRYPERLRAINRESARKRRAFVPETIRSHKYFGNYGIRLEDYERLFREQGGVCAICGGPPGNAKSPHFHVDHDHETGQVRGLLCHSCNTGIGSLKDNPDLLRKAVEYIERKR